MNLNSSLKSLLNQYFLLNLFSVDRNYLKFSKNKSINISDAKYLSILKYIVIFIDFASKEIFFFYFIIPENLYYSRNTDLKNAKNNKL